MTARDIRDGKRKDAKQVEKKRPNTHKEVGLGKYISSQLRGIFIS